MKSSSGTTASGSSSGSDSEESEGNSGPQRRQVKDDDGSDMEVDSDCFEVDGGMQEHGNTCEVPPAAAVSSVGTVEKTPGVEAVEGGQVVGDVETVMAAVQVPKDVETTLAGVEAVGDIDKVEVTVNEMVAAEGEKRRKALYEGGMEAKVQEYSESEQGSPEDKHTSGVWGKPWTALVQEMSGAGDVRLQNEVGEEEQAVETKTGDEEKGEGHCGSGSAFKSRRKGEDGKGQKKDKEGRRKSDRLGGESVGPAQRTRASTKSNDAGEGEDLTPQRKPQTRKSKRAEVTGEKPEQKKKSKRKTHESSSHRPCPDVDSPGGCRSGKKIKPVKFVLESTV